MVNNFIAEENYQIWKNNFFDFDGAPVSSKFLDTFKDYFFDFDAKRVSSKNIEDADTFLDTMKLSDPEAPGLIIATLDQDGTLEEWINALENNPDFTLGKSKEELFKDFAQMANAEQLVYIYEYFDQDPRDRSILTSAIRDHSSDKVKVDFLSKLEDLSKNPDSSMMLDGSNLDSVNAAEILESLSDKPDQLNKACNAMGDDFLAKVLEASLYAREEIDPQNNNQAINTTLDPDDTAFSNIINGVRDSKDADFMARMDTILATLPNGSTKPMVYQPADADNRYIEAVDTTGEVLKNARAGGDSKEIEAAYSKYKEAVMTELEHSYSVRENDTLEAEVFLQDDQAIQTATQKVIKNHQGQDYDADFEASIKAAIIVKQAQYEAGGPDAEVDAEKATMALKGTGDQLGMLDDPQGTVKDLVLNDPTIKQYNQIIVDAVTDTSQSGHERLQSFGDTAASLSQSSYNMMPSLFTTLSANSQTGGKEELADLIERSKASKWQPLDLKAIDNIYTSVQGIPTAEEIQNTIVNTTADKISTPNDYPSSAELWSGIEIGNIVARDDNTISPALYKAIIEKLKVDPQGNAESIKVLTEKYKAAKNNSQSTTTQSTSTSSDSVDELPPNDLIQATNEAQKEYDQATDPADKSEKLTQLHECMAEEIEYASKQIEKYNLFKSGDEITSTAIRMVTQEYHTGEDGEELLSFAQSAAVLDKAEASNCNTDEKKLKVIADGMALYEGKQAVIDQIIADTRTKEYINNISENIQAGQDYNFGKSVWNDGPIDAFRSYDDYMHMPQDRIHYLAQAVNACRSSSELTDALLTETLPQIESDFENLPHYDTALDSVDAVSTTVADLCDIASPLSDKSSTTEKSLHDFYDKMISSTKDYLKKHSAMKWNPITTVFAGDVESIKVTPLKNISEMAVGEFGADPALLIDVADAMAKDSSGNAESIYKGISKGVETFCTETFIESKAKADQSVEQLSFINSGANPFVNTSDPVEMNKHLQFVDDFCKDNPEIQENADMMEDLSARFVLMTDTLSQEKVENKLEEYGLAQDIKQDIETFASDTGNIYTLQQSTGAMAVLNSGEGISIPTLIKSLSSDTQGLRLMYQRLCGISATKNIAIQASQYAMQGDYNGVEAIVQGRVDDGVKILKEQYGKDGVPEYLLTDKKIDEFCAKLVKIEYAKMDYENALVWLNQEKAHNGSIDAAQKSVLEAEEYLNSLFEERPKVDLSYDVTTPKGKVVRGVGLTATMTGLAITLSDLDAPNAVPAAIVGGASVYQNINLMYSMTQAKKAFMADGVANGKTFEAWRQTVKEMDNLGDKMIILGPILTVPALIEDLENQDLYGFATDAAFAAGGLSASVGTKIGTDRLFLEPTKNGGYKFTKGAVSSKGVQIGGADIGLKFTRAGGMLTGIGVALFVGEMAYNWYDNKFNYPHRFENDATQRYWEDVVGLSDGDILMTCNGDGIGAGVVMQADAQMNGYDLSNAEDLSLYKDYINDMSREEKEIYVEGLFEWLDECNLDLEKGYPQVDEINNYKAHQDFQHSLQENNVALPPVRLN